MASDDLHFRGRAGTGFFTSNHRAQSSHLLTGNYARRVDHDLERLAKNATPPENARDSNAAQIVLNELETAGRNELGTKIVAREILMRSWEGELTEGLTGKTRRDETALEKNSDTHEGIDKASAAISDWAIGAVLAGAAFLVAYFIVSGAGASTAFPAFDAIGSVAEPGGQIAFGLISACASGAYLAHTLRCLTRQQRAARILLVFALGSIATLSSLATPPVCALVCFVVYKEILPDLQRIAENTAAPLRLVTRISLAGAPEFALNAKRLAQTYEGDESWVNTMLIPAVESAGRDDLGVLIVAEAVLSAQMEYERIERLELQAEAPAPQQRDQGRGLHFAYATLTSLISMAFYHLFFDFGFGNPPFGAPELSIPICISCGILGLLAYLLAYRISSILNDQELGLPLQTALTTAWGMFWVFSISKSIIVITAFG